MINIFFTVEVCLSFAYKSYVIPCMNLNLKSWLTLIEMPTLYLADTKLTNLRDVSDIYFKVSSLTKYIYSYNRTRIHD